MGYRADDISIEEIQNGPDIPYDLLLLADPSEEMVQSYLQRGRLFVAKVNQDVIGAYVLIGARPETMEIVNIAVQTELQGKGIGKFLLQDAIQRSKSLGAKFLEIGTGNSSIFQLALYQKVGFRIVGIDPDFFIKNYSAPIIENGIQCVDMIRLRMDLL